MSEQTDSTYRKQLFNLVRQTQLRHTGYNVLATLDELKKRSVHTNQNFRNMLTGVGYIEQAIVRLFPAPRNQDDLLKIANAIVNLGLSSALDGKVRLCYMLRQSIQQDKTGTVPGFAMDWFVGLMDCPGIVEQQVKMGGGLWIPRGQPLCERSEAEMAPLKVNWERVSRHWAGTIFNENQAMQNLISTSFIKSRLGHMSDMWKSCGQWDNWDDAPAQLIVDIVDSRPIDALDPLSQAMVDSAKQALSHNKRVRLLEHVKAPQLSAMVKPSSPKF